MRDPLNLTLIASCVLAIFATAHGAAGNAENGAVHCDNSGALEVFG